MEEILDYIIFLIVYIIIDAVWVVGGRKIHSNTVELVQKSPLKINPISVIMYYLIAPLSYVFIVKRYAKTTQEALQLSALIGLLMFGAFDFTNKAIFKDYPWSYTFMDITWGIISMTLTTFIVYRIRHK
jgi:uncharacterized membrane protein